MSKKFFISIPITGQEEEDMEQNKIEDLIDDNIL